MANQSTDSLQYTLYVAARQHLKTTHEERGLTITGIYYNCTSLVMMLEDCDSSLQTRYDAEYAPKPAVLAITKKVSKYDRADIARKAHYYAKINSAGSYRNRLSAGFKLAWLDAKKSNGVVVAISKVIILDVPKPVKIPATLTYPRLFDYDILYYSPRQYAKYTESKSFHSTRNHALRY